MVMCTRLSIIKARISGDNENVFYWKYLLSKKNSKPQQNAPTLALKKDKQLPQLSPRHTFSKK